MFQFFRPPVLAALVLIVAGCASKPEIAAVTAPPPPVALVAAPMPAGGYPGMAIPALLADGAYATPNHALSAAATTWHLRAALNVAALACRGADEAVIVARYNALLTSQKAALKAAEASLSAEFQATGGKAWRDTYDGSMTRLYNFFSQSFARDTFCTSAASVLADAASVPAASFPAFAQSRLPALDRPFVDFYRAYDAWRQNRVMPQMVIAIAGTPAQASAPARVTPPAAPRLSIDIAALTAE